MMRLFPILLALIVSVVLSSSVHATSNRTVPWSDGTSRSEDLRIFVVTFGVGDDIPSWFGHSAVLVRDQRLQVDRIYNYGMFDFGPAMLAKFVRGRLEFWVGEASWSRTQRIYRSLGRSIRLQQLNLSPAKATEIAQFLAWNVRPENRDYLYDHYRDNCSTRIRDIIDRAVDGQFKKATSLPSAQTLRDHTHRYTHRLAALDWLLSFWMADAIDHTISPWNDMFLPLELEDELRRFEYIDESGAKRPMVAGEIEVAQETVQRPQPPQEPPTGWPGTLGLGLFLGALGAWLQTRHSSADSWRSRLAFGGYHAILGGALGISGAALAYLMFGSDHTITYGNENLWLANPATLLLAPLGLWALGRNPRPRRWIRRLWILLSITTLVALVYKVLPGFDQDNVLALALLVPINLCNGIAAMRAGSLSVSSSASSVSTTDAVETP